jgi:hypothetical protein
MNITTTSPLSVITSLNNNVTDGLLGVVLLVIIWTVIYMRQRDEPVREAVAGASFITALVGLLFGFVGFVSSKVFMTCFIILIGSIILLINKPDR